MKKEECWLLDSCKGLHCEDESGCLILYKLNYLFDQAGLSIKQRKNLLLCPDDNGADLEEFRRLSEIKNNIVDYIKNGNQLFIHSKQAGNGKTSWSLKLLQTYFKKIWLTSDLKCKALFINVPAFLISLKQSFTVKDEWIDHIKENCFDCDLIIWDDIGTKSATSFEHENLLSIIDKRINSGKANIFTSNLTNEEMHEALGDRLASRICNLGDNIEFTGGDKRHIKQEDIIAELTKN